MFHWSYLLSLTKELPVGDLTGSQPDRDAFGKTNPNPLLCLCRKWWGWMSQCFDVKGPGYSDIYVWPKKTWICQPTTLMCFRDKLCHFLKSRTGMSTCASNFDYTSHSISMNNLCNHTSCLQSKLWEIDYGWSQAIADWQKVEKRENIQWVGVSCYLSN